MGAELKQRVVRPGRQIEIDHDRDLARLRRLAHRRDEFGKPVVHQHGIDIRYQLAGVGRPRMAELHPAAGGDGLLARGVEQDERHRGGAAGNAHGAAVVDTLAGEIGDDAVAHLVVAAAERAGEGRASAQARDGDRGVGRTAATGDDEFRCRNLGAGCREILHAHDDVLHRDAGAQDFRSFASRRRFNQRRSRSLARRG